VEILATQTAVLARRTAISNGNSSGHSVTLAGLGIDSRLLLKFANSLKLFNFDVRLVAPKSPKRCRADAITACVLPLNETAVASLRRSGWFLPRRTLLYGIGNWNDAAHFYDLGVNALLEKTTDLSFRTAVSSTHSVIGRGIGAYARVPIVTNVTIQAKGIFAKGITRNVGPGGMAVTLSRNLNLPDEIEVDFSLPGTGQLSLRVSPRWYSGLLVGFCFQTPGNRILRKWITKYSRLGK
jgi:PilZ domain